MKWDKIELDKWKTNQSVPCFESGFSSSWNPDDKWSWGSTGWRWPWYGGDDDNTIINECKSNISGKGKWNKDTAAYVHSYDFEVQRSGEMRGCLQHFKYADVNDKHKLTFIPGKLRKIKCSYFTFTNKKFARKNLKCYT